MNLVAAEIRTMDVLVGQWSLRRDLRPIDYAILNNSNYLWLDLLDICLLCELVRVDDVHISLVL